MQLSKDQQLPASLQRRRFVTAVPAAVVLGTGLGAAADAKAEFFTLGGLLLMLLAGGAVVMSMAAVARAETYRARTTPRDPYDPHDPGIEVDPRFRSGRIDLPDGGNIFFPAGQLRPSHPRHGLLGPDAELSPAELKLCGAIAPYPVSRRKGSDLPASLTNAFLSDIESRAKTPVSRVRYVRKMADAKDSRFTLRSVLAMDHSFEILAIYRERAPKSSRGVDIPSSGLLADAWMLSNARDLRRA